MARRRGGSSSRSRSLPTSRGASRRRLHVRRRESVASRRRRSRRGSRAGRGVDDVKSASSILRPRALRLDDAMSERARSGVHALGSEEQTTPGGFGDIDFSESEAPAAGIVEIVGTTARTQGADYVPNNPFQSETLEDGLDRITMIVQEVMYHSQSNIDR